MQTHNHKSTNDIRRVAAFTLIELLVVIAIIALLATISISAVGGVRNRAKKVAKMTVYRQYGQANILYAMDNKGMSCPTIDNDDNQGSWRVYLQPYLVQSAKKKSDMNTDKFYRDPFYEDFNPSNPFKLGVGMNNQLRKPEKNFYPNQLNKSSGGRTLLAAITYPSQRILIGDCSQETSGKPVIYNTNDLSTTRHNSKGMFVRFDGSIAFYDADEAELAFSDPAKLRSL